MKQNSPDRRIRKTKKAIHEAFLELLSQKNFSKITILDVCEHADINRKTFYNHYKDLYDLLDEIENDKVDTMMNRILLQLSDPETRELMTKEEISEQLRRKILEFFTVTIREVKNEKEFYRRILRCEGHSKLLSKIVAREKAYLQQHLILSPEYRDWLEYYLIFIVDGAMAVVDRWLDDEAGTTDEQLADFFTRIFTMSNAHASFAHLKFC